MLLLDLSLASLLRRLPSGTPTRIVLTALAAAGDRQTVTSATPDGGRVPVTARSA
jgi:hypothetical protein